MRRAWVIPAVYVAFGALVATAFLLHGSPGTAAVELAVFVLLAALNSPLLFPRSVGNDEARRRSEADGRPIVYWRPGCAYCVRLRLGLGRSARRLHWVDIRHDAEGASVVRAANGGDETVPTIVVDGRPHTNPDLAWVRAQLCPRG